MYKVKEENERHTNAAHFFVKRVSIKRLEN